MAKQNQFMAGIHAGFWFIGLLAVIGLVLALMIQNPSKATFSK